MGNIVSKGSSRDAIVFDAEAFSKSLEFAKNSRNDASPMRMLILSHKDEIKSALERGVPVFDIWKSFDSAVSQRCSLRYFSNAIRELSLDRRGGRGNRRRVKRSRVPKKIVEINHDQPEGAPISKTE